MSQLPLAVRLPDHANFENFVAGDNSAALSAIHTMALQQTDPMLWLWGAESTGKTHLLQAACSAAGDAGMSAAYLPLAQWQTAGPDVLTGWEDQSLVCIDDIDAVAGRQDWELALFALFNVLADRGGSMVAVAKGAPRACGFELPDLVSRLESGAVFRLAVLDEADRTHALTLRCRRRGLDLPAETAQWLARHYRRDLHSLFDLLETLDIASLAAQRRLTVPFVRTVLFPPGTPNAKDKRTE